MQTRSKANRDPRRRLFLVVVAPKVPKFRKQFTDRLKKTAPKA